MFQVLGPQRIGLGPLIPITFFYVVIFITGVIGNVAVCLVIVKNKSMHTATNYYLFSLAISDLMILALGKNLRDCVIFYWINNSKTKIISNYPYVQKI